MEAKFVLLVVFIFVIVLSLFLTYIFSQPVFVPPKPKVDINAELAKLNPDPTTLQIINSADCKNLEKTEEFWVVKDCKDDVYFKLFLQDGGYYLSYCTSWSSPREAFLKLRNFLPIKNCLNESTEDKLLNEVEFKKVYEVCGLKVLFVKECIVGVRP